MNTTPGRLRTWKPISLVRHPGSSDPLELLSEVVIDLLDGSSQDLRAVAVWDASDRTVRQFAHFWPIEARAIGDVGVAVACDGHHEGDLIVATLELDHDETLPIMIDMPSSHVSEMFQVLYWDIELQEDRLITVHDNDTTEFLACGLYDERVRNQYRDRDAELEDE